jgi:hypothetical protein
VACGQSHLLKKRPGDRLFDQDTGTGEAHLARVSVLTGNSLGSGIEVGIGADDER